MRFPFNGHYKAHALIYQGCVRVRMRSGATSPSHLSLHGYWTKKTRWRQTFPASKQQTKGTMSLLQLGEVIFGGTPRIIAYLRQNHLLATAMACTIGKISKFRVIKLTKRYM
jgi:hypothetical protein